MEEGKMQTVAAEGKTLGFPGVKCEFCEEADSIKFCVECKQPMCGQCTKIHGRGALTKTHNVISIEDYNFSESKTTVDVSKAYCAKHQQRVIDKICEDCLVVMCAECEPNHRGHKLGHGSFDVNFLHRVNAQKVPGLMEIIQELSELKGGTPEKIQMFKEAERLVKSWKDQLLDILNRDADILLGKLNDEIRKHEQILTDTSSKIKEYKEKTEQQMTQRSESWKISNTTDVLNKMSHFDKEIEDVKLFIETVDLSQNKQTMSDILPFRDNINKVVEMAKTLFTIGEQNEKRNKPKTKPRVSLHTRRSHTHITGVSTKSPAHRIYGDLKLTNEGMLHKSSDDFRLCGTHLQSPPHFAVYEVSNNKIHMFDRNLNYITTRIFRKKILKMVMLNEKTYVVLEYQKKNVYLTNEKFEILNNIVQSDSRFELRGLCTGEEEKCIITEIQSITNMQITEINIDGGKIWSKILGNVKVSSHWNSLLAYSENGFVIFSDTTTSLCAYNIQTGEMSKVYTSKSCCSAVCGDKDGVFVGTESGCVYQLIQGQQSVPVLQELGKVRGLQTTDSCVVVLLKNKLQIYKPQ